MVEPVTVNRGACPPLETIGAFLEGRLDGAERETTAAHLAACETCYFVFSEAAAVKPVTTHIERDDRTVTRRQVMWGVVGGLAAAAVLLLAFNIYWPGGRPASDPALDDLVAAVGSERIIEPRLTGGFAYGRLRTFRSGQPAGTALSPDVRIAIANIDKVPSTSGPALQVRGVAALLSGNVDMAISMLDDAVRMQPGNPSALNDLASAYLVRADHPAATEDLSKALASLNRALEADPRLPEARFNRACVFERMQRLDEARLAWQAYLMIDDRSGWADEARARLRTLTNQP